MFLMLMNTRLTNLRKKAGLSQKALAEKIGVTQGMISQCELGQKDFSRKNKIKLALFFNVSVQYLFYDEYQQLKECID
ncbi:MULTISPECIES: helix-turn-helix transcriptional regulator [Bacillaceae]|uniref:HTH cro/C1-type domain-containing protein n=1 Tax=Domibacillus aminovorans TaxID=29332 RepID=A0A177L007_9BACI|nr:MULTISPECIES: helix-turn-helix transcriptional regulator [Bacillaceae]OAH58664.1 hypothetical protein AWH48_16840 [Domibacillus aminovorans]